MFRLRQNRRFKGGGELILHVDILKESLAKNRDYVFLPFYKNGKPFLESHPSCGIYPVPLWGMSLLAAGSMRFRWNEENPNRDDFLRKLAGSECLPNSAAKKTVPLELIHSKTVYDLESGDETFGKQGDGMITRNEKLIPVVTVSDCVPIYFYDTESRAFGIVHSGWKGTGIIADAISLAKKNYGANEKNILVAIGAHIKDCCYAVDEARAKFFADAFGARCVKKIDGADGEKHMLSLERANLAVLEKIGIREENIVVAKNCTCCESAFGSFRRQAAPLDIADKSRAFTVQAAFVIGG